MTLIIIQQVVGLPVTYDADTKKPWTSGIAKTPTLKPLQLGLTNLEGDGKADLRHHGGADKAVLAYPAAHYPAWHSTIDLPLGRFGENWTIAGANESDMCLGDIMDVGSARVQVSQPRQPCWKLSRRWNMPDLARIAQQKGWLGWYFRVLSVGTVQVGDAMRLVERTLLQWRLPS